MHVSFFPSTLLCTSTPKICSSALPPYRPQKSLVGCPMAFRCSQPGLQWVHSQDAFLYHVRHVHARVGEQFLFVCKCSPGHKAVLKANRQHPAVAYFNKKMHLPTILPHSTACCCVFFFPCPLSKKASIHIYFSAFWVLLFTTKLVPAHSCQGSWWQAEEKRVSGRRSLLRCCGSAAEVDSQIRGESTGRKAAAVRWESGAHVELQDKIRGLTVLLPT